MACRVPSLYGVIDTKDTALRGFCWLLVMFLAVFALVLELQLQESEDIRCMRTGNAAMRILTFVCAYV